MDRMGPMESYLFEKWGSLGYDVLDAIVQANLKIESFSIEELERVVGEMNTRPAAVFA